MVSDAFPQPEPPRDFAVPETCTILHGRCPHCGGNVKGEDGEISCVWCARSLQAAVIDTVGRVLAYSSPTYRPPVIKKVGGVVKLRARRDVHYDQGVTGRAARVLTEIPFAPYCIGVSAIGRALNMSNPDVREAVDSLMSIGLIEEVVYGDGGRWIGYCLAGGSEQA